MKDYARLSSIKGDANAAKSRLIDVMDKLLCEGFIKEAEQLEKIIIRLEVWQNK